MKIDTDDELPLNKLVNFPTMTVIIRPVFEKKNIIQILSTIFFRQMFV